MSATNAIKGQVPELSTAVLKAANINPDTYLATDYLNHFNEIVMLIEMLPDAPDMAGDVLAWQPKSYTEHFRESNFAERDLAIAAYIAAPQPFRHDFDTLIKELDTVFMTCLEELRRALDRGADLTAIVTLVSENIHPLMEQARALINGTTSSIVESDDAQSAVDALFA